MNNSSTSASGSALTIGLLNVRSIRNKVEYIVELLSEFHLDLLCITETWLLESDANIIKAALPKTHSLLHVPRPLRVGDRGGGVAVIYSLALSSTRIIPSNLNFSSFEYMEVVISRNCSVLRIALVYRPGHSGTDRLFMDEFDSFIELFSSKNGRLLMCGDFNYWIDDPARKPYSSEFVELLDSNNFVNHVQIPTHASGHTLDLVLSPSGSRDVADLDVVPIDSSISDHDMVLFHLMFQAVPSHIKTVSFRKYPRVIDATHLRNIERTLNEIDSSAMTARQLVQTHNDYFSSVSSELCTDVSKNIIVRDDGQWFDASIVNLRRQRRRAERKWRRVRTESSRRQFVAARQAVVIAVAQRKREYYRNKIASCDGDLGRLFRIMGGLMKRSDSTLPYSLSSADLASSFSNFFSEKIVRIRDELERGPQTRGYLVNFDTRPRMILAFLSNFEHISLPRLRVIIKEAKKTFCALDPLNVSKMGCIYEYSIPFIKKIVDKCFDESTFVISEKKSLINPTIKRLGLDQDNIANYRPVSNLTFLSKIIERAMLDQVISVLKANNIIPVHQSAYRQLHSTETALCKIYNDLVINTCHGHASLLILLDLTAAFDTVDHGILIEELFDCGIRDNALALFRSYLENRYQQVVVDGKMSESSELHCGVPQGSVLGPVLFLVYTRSLASLLAAHGVESHFYADDCQIYLPIANIDESKSKALELLHDIRAWMYERKLKLNEGKTEVMLIKGNLRTNIAQDFGTLDFEGSSLAPTEVARNLGIYFDPELSFKKQIEMVVKNCNLQIRNIYAIKKYLNYECLHALVHSLVISRIDYCNSLYVSLPNYLLKKLQSVMNRSARLIYSLPPRVPTTSYLIDLHWLPVKARIEFKICLLAFKALKFGEPRYLADLLTLQNVGSGMNLRVSDDPFRLMEPRATSERHFSERSFSYIAPRLLNRLPVSLKELDSVETFKSKLKSFLFVRAFDISDRSVNVDYRV